MVKIREDVKQAIANRLLGTCLAPRDICNEFGCDPFTDDLYVGMAAEDCGVWQCESCGWWIDEAELVDTRNGVYCKECNNDDY